MHRLLAAMNAHDLDAFVACFAPDYRSEQPAHPARAFEGSGQVRENWTSVFSGVPDFRAELVLSVTTEAGVEIGEWRWRGTHTDGAAFAMDGVIVLGIVDARDRLGTALHGAGGSGRRRDRRDGSRHLPPEHLVGSTAVASKDDRTPFAADEAFGSDSAASRSASALASIVVVLLWPAQLVGRPDRL